MKIGVPGGGDAEALFVFWFFPVPGGLRLQIVFSGLCSSWGYFKWAGGWLEVLGELRGKCFRVRNTHVPLDRPFHGCRVILHSSCPELIYLLIVRGFSLFPGAWGSEEVCIRKCQQCVVQRLEFAFSFSLLDPSCPPEDMKRTEKVSRWCGTLRPPEVVRSWFLAK